MIEGIGRFAHARYGFCIVALCQGKIPDKNSFKDFYAFVAVEPQNYDYFRKSYKRGEAGHFDAYGLELLRGWGAEPPADIMEYVRSRHSVDFDAPRHFIDRLLAQSFLDKVSLSPFPLKQAASHAPSQPSSGEARG